MFLRFLKATLVEISEVSKNSVLGGKERKMNNYF